MLALEQPPERECFPGRARRFSAVIGIGFKSRMRGRTAPKRVVPRKCVLSSLAAGQEAEAFFCGKINIGQVLARKGEVEDEYEAD